MGAIERLKQYCEENDIPLSRIEKNLGYGNSALVKAKSLKDDRMKEICEYLGIPVEYLLADDDEMHMTFTLEDNAMSPKFIYGDLLTVIRTDTVGNDRLGVFNVNGKPLFRKFRQTATGYYLIPFNPDYETLFFTEMPEVIGTVSRLVRKL